MEEELDTIDEDASRWSRLAAALLDMLLVLPVTIILMLSLGIGGDVKLEDVATGKRLLISGLSLGFYFAINWQLLRKRAQTFGKRLLRIRIVNLDGTRPAMGDLLLRRYVPYFGFPYVPVIGGLLNLVNVCFIFANSRRCVHDHIAGTRVVRAASY